MIIHTISHYNHNCSKQYISVRALYKWDEFFFRPQNHTAEASHFFPRYSDDLNRSIQSSLIGEFLWAYTTYISYSEISISGDTPQMDGL